MWDIDTKDELFILMQIRSMLAMSWRIASVMSSLPVSADIPPHSSRVSSAT